MATAGNPSDAHEMVESDGNPEWAVFRCAKDCGYEIEVNRSTGKNEFYLCGEELEQPISHTRAMGGA